MTMTCNVLVADACDPGWSAIAQGIRREIQDVSILRVKDGEQAVRFAVRAGLFSSEPIVPDLIVLALDLPIMSAASVLAHLSQEACRPPVIVVARDEHHALPDTSRLADYPITLIECGDVAALEEQVATTVRRVMSSSGLARIDRH